MQEELRSNLPLRPALAFDELAPIVPILVLLRSQPLQWRSAWAVRASSHWHWTIHRPRGIGGWREARHIAGEKKQRKGGCSVEEEAEEGRLLCRRRSRWGKQLGEHGLLCSQSGYRTIVTWIAMIGRVEFGARVWSNGWDHSAGLWASQRGY